MRLLVNLCRATPRERFILDGDPLGAVADAFEALAQAAEGPVHILAPGRQEAVPSAPLESVVAARAPELRTDRLLEELAAAIPLWPDLFPAGEELLLVSPASGRVSGARLARLIEAFRADPSRPAACLAPVPHAYSPAGLKFAAGLDSGEPRVVLPGDRLHDFPWTEYRGSVPQGPALWLDTSALALRIDAACPGSLLSPAGWSVPADCPPPPGDKPALPPPFLG